MAKLRPEQPFAAQSELAVVTIAAGQKALELFEFTGPQMQAYAQRCGAYFHVITDDQFPAYPLGNKWRLHYLTKNYRRTLFLDVDVWVRDGAPNLFENYPAGKIWMHRDKPELESTDWIIGESELAASQQQVPAINLQVYNTGVVLFDAEHCDMWKPPRLPAPPRHLTEQTNVEYEIDRLGFEVADLPIKYNSQWWMPRFKQLEHDAEFVHLANCSHDERVYRFRKLRHESRKVVPVGEKINLDSYRSLSSAKLDQVALITTHFNPTRSTRRRETYYEWLATLGPLAKAVKCYELVLDDDTPEIEGARVIRGTRSLNAVWQKEALINLAMFQASEDIKYIAWLDHDFVFGESDWLNRAIDKIDRGAIAVQLFSQAKYLSADQTVELAIPSAMCHLQESKPTEGCNPGGPWMADAKWIRQIGLYDRCIVGGGDQVVFSALTGTRWVNLANSPTYMQISVGLWLDRARALAAGARADYLRGDVYHLNHGSLENRRYADRHQILMRHDFDPMQDIGLNSDGLLTWNDTKPQLHDDVLSYFFSRHEDQ